MVPLKTVLQLALCVAGIYGAYLTQGVVQETLSTKRFGPDGERFTHLSALNALQSWVCFVWAFLLLNLWPQGDLSKSPPFTAYWKAGVTNCIGPACGFEALKYISYSAQVLAKSSKMIPVMLIGVVLHGKAYSALEYTCCLLISGGISLFALHSDTKVTSRLIAPNAPLGYALCAVNLLLDGYTNTAQDEIHRRYPGGKPLQMMCWMNFWCGLFNLPWLFGFSTVGADLLAFVVRNPEAGYDMLLFCLCGAVGQLFIYYTIKTFGSLTLTLIATTRKFFNILLSVLWSGNPLLPLQWGAVGMVFGGLLASSVAKSRAHRKKPSKAKKA